MSEQELKDFATRMIREEFAAQGIAVKQIILFGSRARGEGRPDSDWDFLVIVPMELTVHERSRLATMIRRKFAAVYLAADIVIKSEVRLRQERGNVGVISYYALKEGVLV